jgi:hypothetical protein
VNPAGLARKRVNWCPENLMDEQTISRVTPTRTLLSNPALRLAVFAGISTFVVTFAIGYFVEKLRVSKNEGATYALLFWSKFVAGPLAASTLVGVLSSRARQSRSISPRQTAITVAATPFVAFCMFSVTYFIISAFYYGPNTPLVIFSIFAMAFSTVVIVVRWSVHLFCGLKRPS